MQRGARSAEANHALHVALHRFSGVGSALVAVLVGTGLVNSWVLVGPGNLEGLWTTPYGQLLSLKLLVFVGMFGLAAANRFRLTPGLARAIRTNSLPDEALAALRHSILLEVLLGLAVLFLVAWFGTLAPPASA
jgi:putative copper resistance protein D